MIDLGFGWIFRNFLKPGLKGPDRVKMSVIPCFLTSYSVLWLVTGFVSSF